MIRGLDVSSAGMLAQQQRFDSVANNLANVSTAGYRRQITAINSFSNVLGNVTLPPVMPPFPMNPAPTPAPNMLCTVDAVDTQNGKLRTTSLPTDLALQGDGYFAIQTPTGEVYTRNGAFTLAAGGKLVSQEGYQVMGEQGPVTVNSANWRVTSQGDVVEDGKVTNRLKLVTLDPASVTRAGSTAWKAANVTKATQLSITQGSLEESNVNPVMEMISMITATRNFEANQRVVQALDATLDRAVNDIAR
ncbi:MAG TPA: flagellar hook-basal body protein [Armatimonadota bacterium]|jgi:flagellar basal-body rod protein FlgG